MFARVLTYDLSYAIHFYTGFPWFGSMTHVRLNIYPEDIKEHPRYLEEARDRWSHVSSQ